MLRGRLRSSVSRHSMPTEISSSRPAALMRGPTAKPRSVLTQRAGCCPIAAECFDAGDRLSGPYSRQALLHQDTVVVVQRHHVGDRTQRDEVEVLRRHFRRPCWPCFCSNRDQVSPSGKTRRRHPRDCGSKTRCREIWINDYIGIRQFVRRQVMIGDSTAMPAALAAATPAILDTPLSTVTISAENARPRPEQSRGLTHNQTRIDWAPDNRFLQNQMRAGSAA